MAKFGLRSTGTNQYFYSEGDSGQSAAAGVETSTGHYRVVLSTTPGADPTGTNAVLDFNTAANGNLNITPNGSGSVVISKTTIQGGSIDNTSLGATTPSTVVATSVTTNTVNSSSGSIALNSGLTVSSSGITTNAVQPSFLAILSANTATNVTGDGTSYTIIFDSVIYDQGSHYNNSTGVFTAPVAGKYLFVYSCSPFNFGAAHTAMFMEVVTTARTYLPIFIDPYAVNGTASQVGISATVIANMAANDTAHCSLVISGGTKTVGVAGTLTNAPTFFSGYLIG